MNDIITRVTFISELNRFIEALDRRLDESSKAATGFVAKKIRQIGSFSTLVAPDDAPTWSVRTQNQGDHIIILFTVANRQSLEHF